MREAVRTFRKVGLWTIIFSSLGVRLCLNVTKKDFRNDHIFISLKFIEKKIFGPIDEDTKKTCSFFKVVQFLLELRKKIFANGEGIAFQKMLFILCVSGDL